jgi:rubrerythrin
LSDSERFEVHKKEASEYLQVIADKDSGTYSIRMTVRRDLPIGTILSFPKWELADAIEKAAHFEMQGLRDEEGPNVPVREAYKEREAPVYREKETIREIVKIRCRHCGTLFEEKMNRCPHCGAPP